MRKSLKLFTAILLTAFLTAFIPINKAQAAQSGDFTYVINNGEVEITKYTGNSENLTIPNKLGGYPVTALGIDSFRSCYSLKNVVVPNVIKKISDGAFEACQQLMTINIPQGVTTIGNRAFWSCANLSQISIPSSVIFLGNYAFTFINELNEINVDNKNPNYSSLNGVLFDKAKTVLIQYPCKKSGNYVMPNSVKEIKAYAFEGCEGLTAITIPTNLTRIGNCAFEYCTALKNIYISKNVTVIEDSVFNYCINLDQINVDSANKFYSSLNGVLYNKDKTTIVKYPEGKSGEYVVPDSVTCIGYRSFYNCKKLTGIAIGSLVTSIEKDAFSNCDSLKEVNVGVNVIEIGDGAFSYCGNLSKITLPNKLKKIGTSAFNSTNISSIEIPESVTDIGYCAFYTCEKLTQVFIPKNVVKIGDTPFYNCTSLVDITVDPLNKNYSSQDGVLYDKSMTTLLQYPAGKQGSYNIPNGVTSIGESAFFFCSGLTDVNIPGSITDIGYSAFMHCSGLTTVVIPNSVTNISGQLFANCIRLKTITLGNKTQNIGTSAFHECSSLVNISLPQSITHIDDYAFIRCSSLNKVTFWGNAPTLGSRVFENCASGFKIYYRSDKSGFTSPTWKGYPTEKINVSFAPVVTATAGDGQATLSWKPVSGAVKYFIYSYNPTTKTYTSLANVTGTSYTKTGLTNSTLYTYLVRAYNGVYYSSFTTANHINVKPIATPVVTATAGDRAVTLKWKALTGADKYYIYTYNASTKQYTYVTSTTATSYVHKNLTNGTAYTYMVKAYNGVSYSQYSTHVTAKPIAAPKVTATPGNAMVTLKWSAIPGATKYYVYLYNSASKTYTSLGAVTTVSFVHKNLTNGTTYTYLVRANNGISSSAFTTANHVTAKSIATPN